MVSVVGDNLGAAVREFHPVFTLDSSILVLGLSFGEVVAVVVDTSVLVGKGLWWSLFLEDGNKFENMSTITLDVASLTSWYGAGWCGA